MNYLNQNMLKNKLIYKSLLIIIIFLSPLLINLTNFNGEIPNLNSSTVGFYQGNTCNVSFLEFVNKNGFKDNYEIRFDSKSDISCYGNIKYIEPAENNFVIFVGLNLLATILIQSSIWLVLISFINSESKSTENNTLSLIHVLITAFMFTFHFLNESTFYSYQVENYSSYLNFEDYFGLNIFLTFFIITYFLYKICTPRVEKLILYFPLVFLLNGVYSNSNINFFLLIFTFYGLKNFFNFNSKNLIFSSVYFAFVLFWYTSVTNIYSFFDIDKLNGLSASSNAPNVILFWSIIFFFTLNGLFYLVKQNRNFDYIKIYNNFLFTGFLISLLGFLGAYNPVLNKLIYLFFGQNKPSIGRFESIAGNTWRGYASSAEMIGEFYGIILLLTFLLFFHKKIIFKYYQYIFLLFIFIGFYRANNVASLITLALIIVIILIQRIFQDKGIRISVYTFLIVTIIIGSYFILRQNTYAYMGQSVVFEGLSASNIEINDDEKFRYINRLLDERDYLSILGLFEGRNELSTSLTFITETLTNQNNIKYLPNLVAITSTLALFINRAEKWGIFFAKYDPIFSDFLFGYGPYNLVNYNFDNNIINDGLVLPHSSYLSYLVFFGIVGISFLFAFVIYILINYKKRNNLTYYLIIFQLVNYSKSDGLLYLSSIVLFLTLLFSMMVNNEEHI